MLDVSMVLNDPLLSDTFTVRRNTETVGQNGRVIKVPEAEYPDVRGIVTAMEPSELVISDDSQVVNHAIEVLTTFPLRDARFGYQPDIVIWDGIEYKVLQAIPYQRIAGHTQAQCASYRATDKPQ